MLSIKEIKQIKKAIKEVKAWVISKDYELYQKKDIVYSAYNYKDCFTDDFKSISLFTKDLLGNCKGLINDRLNQEFKAKYGIELRDFDFLTSSKYINYLIDRVNDGENNIYCYSKINNFFKGYLKSKV